MKKKEIIQTSDLIELFLLEKTTQKKDSIISVSKLYEVYKDWCFTNGHDYHNITIFSRSIVKKGIEKKKTNRGFIFVHIILLQESDFL